MGPGASSSRGPGSSVAPSSGPGSMMGPSSGPGGMGPSGGPGGGPGGMMGPTTSPGSSGGPGGRMGANSGPGSSGGPGGMMGPSSGPGGMMGGPMTSPGASGGASPGGMTSPSAQSSAGPGPAGQAIAAPLPASPNAGGQAMQQQHMRDEDEYDRLVRLHLQGSGSCQPTCQGGHNHRTCVKHGLAETSSYHSSCIGRLDGSARESFWGFLTWIRQGASCGSCAGHAHNCRSSCQRDDRQNVEIREMSSPRAADEEHLPVSALPKAVQHAPQGSQAAAQPSTGQPA